MENFNYPGDLGFDKMFEQQKDETLNLELTDVKVTKREIPIIEKLKPKSTLHKNVLEYLEKRLKVSGEKISQLHSKWTYDEQKYYAYLSPKYFEDTVNSLAKSTDKDVRFPSQEHIVMPLSFFTIDTIVTYITTALDADGQIFKVAPYDIMTTQDTAFLVESLLNQNADYTKFTVQMRRNITDTQVYGTGCMKNFYMQKERIDHKTGKTVVEYDGNKATSISPFCILPDPSVMLTDCTRDGEFFFVQEFVSDIELMKRKSEFYPPWVEEGKKHKAKDYFTGTKTSDSPALDANIRYSINQTLSQQNLSANSGDNATGTAQQQIVQGTIWIVPKELKLGKGEEPELWIFTIMNGSQIIQAQPFEVDHGEHPYLVAEPQESLYRLGSFSTLDFIGIMQDYISWLLNSHMDNVRSVVNKAIVVDPQSIEIADMVDPKFSGIIRKKPGAPLSLNESFYQLTNTMATDGHINDVMMITKLSQMVSSANENLVGQSMGGGRRTAAEIRTKTQAGANRLGQLTKAYYAQLLAPLARQQVMNLQQFLENDAYVKDVSGIIKQVQPKALTGVFQYPIHDGSSPTDKTGLLESWGRVMGLVQEDPQLRQMYDFGKIFEFVAKLGGASNIQQMKMQQPVAPQPRQNMFGEGGMPVNPGTTPRPGQPSVSMETLNQLGGK